VTRPPLEPNPAISAEADELGPVKFFEFLRAPAGSPGPRLRQRWAEERSSWLGRRGELAQYLKRHELYERCAVEEQRVRSGVEMPDTGFEAVSVQWFESRAAYDHMRSVPGVEELTQLDRRFRDASVAAVLTGAPHVIVGPAGGEPSSKASLICILRRASGMDLGTFHDHWLHHHGGLFQAQPELRDPLLGYEQNHGLDIGGAEYDGVTQQWFASFGTWSASLERAAHAEIVAPDVAYFLDPERIHFIVAGQPLRIFG
jgi:EthD domain